MLARTKKYRESSYFNTTSPSNTEAFSSLKKASTFAMSPEEAHHPAVVTEQRSEEQEHTTDDEKDMYSTLVRELTRIDKGGQQKKKQLSPEERTEVKLHRNLQGEIGS